MRTNLRRLDASDIEAVLRIQNTCYEPLLQEQAPALLSKMALSPTTCYGVEDGSGELVAYGIAFPSDEEVSPELNTVTTTASSVNTLYIHDIAVVPTMRSRGLGTLILERMIQDAVRLELQTMALTAVGGASDYWLRHGFQHTGEIATGYGQGASRMKLTAAPGQPPAPAR